ncbi:atp adp translocase [Vairimorpha apis BRL 01]|uniref:ADP,ATP carrier protein n=1 Tax=Vairimorpha apis BRL 01 TaxID=1037528 RepID=T0KXM9_9MICR|nr:atp adp translocase [Vairimorpha apis BRL 01]
MKDSAVLGKQHPTSIMFLKFFIILPLSVISVGLIQKYLEKYPFTVIFNFMLIFFAVSFIILGIVILPFSSYIQVGKFWARDLFADDKFKACGLDFLFAFALVFNEWTSSLLYVLSEMFGSLILSYFFMTFANSLTTPDQSGRFVPLFYIFANIALFSSGLLCKCVDGFRSGMSYEESEKIFNIFFVISGILTFTIFGLKWYLEKYVTIKKLFIEKQVKEKKKKVKSTFSEGLIEMSKSRLLFFISLITLFYAASTNIIESSYKAALTYGADIKDEAKGEYARNLNSWEQIAVALAVIVILLTPFPKLIKTKGWVYVAMVSPLLTLFSTLGTLILAWYNYPITNKESSIFLDRFTAKDNSKVVLENIIGIISVALMKIHKYAAFDITKEALAMRIDESKRAQYKSIFDGIFGKLGKSIGSIYAIVMLGILNGRDIRKAAPISFVILVFFCIVWIYAVKYLDRKYNESIQKNTPIDIDLFTKGKNQNLMVETPSKSVKTDF